MKTKRIMNDLNHVRDCCKQLANTFYDLQRENSSEQLADINHIFVCIHGIIDAIMTNYKDFTEYDTKCIILELYTLQNKFVELTIQR